MNMDVQISFQVSAFNFQGIETAVGLLGPKAAVVLVFCRTCTLLSIAAAPFAFPPTVHAGVL